ncbi:hypothetical protein F0562_013475 [Nyssa sinensis]|uniref:Uncharacterized protein n=1 Tax=Nyssa sinensis TaxID=561372 RepID=A0A5J4ZMN6_9ASTE|nr:hypothetical protein F0562_013475 [Nyssa sinensis]
MAVRLMGLGSYEYVDITEYKKLNYYVLNNSDELASYHTWNYGANLKAVEANDNLYSLAYGDKRIMWNDFEALQLKLYKSSSMWSQIRHTTFINDDTSDEDDDALTDYCNDEEDQLSIDDDTVIDE